LACTPPRGRRPEHAVHRLDHIVVESAHGQAASTSAYLPTVSAAELCRERLDAQCAIDLELLLGQDLIAPRPAKQLQ
jgi:hypothetical protein